MINIYGKDISVHGRLVRIARLAHDGYEFLENPETTIEAIRKSGVRVDIFSFMQKLTETSPKYQYPMEWDNLAALPISSFDEWWTKQIGFKARNKAKQAEKKGLTIREVAFDDTLVRGIWEIYNECPVRQGRRFHHYGKDLETIRRISATFMESSFFIGAFLGEKLVGFAKLTSDQAKSQAALMHIIAMVRHRDKAPTNALIAQAVKSCAERGIPNLVYSKFSYGKKQRDTLSDFKENSGFKRVELPRYHVPLTLMGRLALRMGLHHSFHDRVPESVVTKYRDFRNEWYKRKAQSPTEAS